MKKRKTHWTILERVPWYARRIGESHATQYYGAFSPAACTAPTTRKRWPRKGPKMWTVVCPVHGEVVCGPMPDGTIRMYCDGGAPSEEPQRSGDRMLLKRQTGRLRPVGARERVRAVEGVEEGD